MPPVEFHPPVQTVSLSVLIPVYNGASYVAETVRAVVAQSYRDLELIIIENASTDGTRELLQRLMAELNDSRIRLFLNEKTLPPAQNWNLALSQVRGEFVKVVCADDVPSPGSFDRQIDALRAHPGVVLTTGAKGIMDAHGNRIFVKRSLRRKGVYKGRELIRRCILAGTNIIDDPVHVMWRRSAMEKTGLLDLDVYYAADVEFWFRFLSHGDLFNDSEVTGWYRIHSGAISSGKWRATARGFIGIAKLQIRNGVISLNSLELMLIKIRAYGLGVLRELFYIFAA